eukprot:TRINITY_DN618_c0_g2_i2.p1 TRINITY_DN618_c0_g2~~TRINITY_DN618_c0_g2_i2.p1  ORF type:complete len:1098 (-),score=222.53 TRINITY_DN618_c0_g2_i2:630-3923(-)
MPSITFSLLFFLSLALPYATGIIKYTTIDFSACEAGQRVDQFYQPSLGIDFGYGVRVLSDDTGNVMPPSPKFVKPEVGFAVSVAGGFVGNFTIYYSNQGDVSGSIQITTEMYGGGTTLYSVDLEKTGSFSNWTSISFVFSGVAKSFLFRASNQDAPSFYFDDITLRLLNEHPDKGIQMSFDEIDDGATVRDYYADYGVMFDSSLQVFNQGVRPTLQNATVNFFDTINSFRFLAYNSQNYPFKVYVYSQENRGGVELMNTTVEGNMENVLLFSGGRSVFFDFVTPRGSEYDNYVRLDNFLVAHPLSLNFDDLPKNYDSLNYYSSVGINFNRSTVVFSDPRYAIDSYHHVFSPNVKNLIVNSDYNFTSFSLYCAPHSYTMGVSFYSLPNATGVQLGEEYLIPFSEYSNGYYYYLDTKGLARSVRFFQSQKGNVVFKGFSFGISDYTFESSPFVPYSMPFPTTLNFTAQDDNLVHFPSGFETGSSPDVPTSPYIYPTQNNVRFFTDFGFTSFSSWVSNNVSASVTVYDDLESMGTVLGYIDIKLNSSYRFDMKLNGTARSVLFRFASPGNTKLDDFDFGVPIHIDFDKATAPRAAPSVSITAEAIEDFYSDHGVHFQGVVALYGDYGQHSPPVAATISTDSNLINTDFTFIHFSFWLINPDYPLTIKVYSSTGAQGKQLGNFVVPQSTGSTQRRIDLYWNGLARSLTISRSERQEIPEESKTFMDDLEFTNSNTASESIPDEVPVQSDSSSSSFTSSTTPTLTSPADSVSSTIREIIQSSSENYGQIYTTIADYFNKTSDEFISVIDANFSISAQSLKSNNSGVKLAIDGSGNATIPFSLLLRLQSDRTERGLAIPSFAVLQDIKRLSDVLKSPTFLTSSNVIGLTLLDSNGNVIEIVNSTELITIFIQLNALRNESTVCSYWNETLNSWETNGCTVGSNSTDYQLECNCNHLTNFTGGSKLVSPVTQPTPSSSIVKGISDGVFVAIILSCLAFLAILLVIWFVFTKKKNMKQKMEDQAVELVTTKAIVKELPGMSLVMEDEIGRGAFGKVYKALQGGTTTLAVKVYNQGHDKKSILERERDTGKSSFSQCDSVFGSLGR